MLFIGLSIGILAGLSAQSQVPAQFGASSSLQGVQGPGLRKVLSGDLDQDGHTDLVGVGIADGQRALISRHGLGEGLFEFMQTIDTFSNLPWEESIHTILADLDGDGDQDIIDVRSTGLFHFLNDGKGRFANPWVGTTLPPTIAISAKFVAAGDVDSDGDVDLILALWGRPDLVYLNDGKLVFTVAAKQPSSRLTLTYQLHLADVDGDTDLDMVTVSHTNQALVPAVEVFTNDGKGAFTLSSGIPSSLQSVGNIVRCDIADIDNDKDVDLILRPSRYSAGTYFLSNSGTGVFTVSRTTAYRGIPADMDGDGDLDLAGTIERYYENTGTSFTPRATSITTNTYLTGLADYDGDGDIDMLGAGERLYSNQGGGRFARLFRPRTSGGVLGHGDQLGDLDGDGDLDHVILRRIYSRGGSIHPFYIQLNDGHGFFTPEPQTSPVSARAVDFLTSSLVDIDGDGDLDLFYGNSGGDHVYLNDGKAHFTDASASWLPSEFHFTWRAIFADLDGDKDLDMVTDVSSDIYQRTGVRMRLYLNTGKAFVDATAARLPMSPGALLSLRAADLDGDKDLDLLTPTAAGMRMLLNNGSGSFKEAASSQFPMSTVGGDVRVGDLDGDGDLDIASKAGKEILINSGKGVFTSTALPALPALGQSFLLFDVDEDDDLDLLIETADNRVGTSWLKTINVLLINDGKGRFSGAPSTRLPISIQWDGSETVGDIDGDDDIDLVGRTTWINLHRQLSAPHRARIGGRLRLENFVQPGYTAAQTSVWPILGVATVKPLALPFWGNLHLAPSSMVMLQELPVPISIGMTTLDLSVPNSATLVGLTVYSQTWIRQGSDWTKWRLTNLWQETVLR